MKHIIALIAALTVAGFVIPEEAAAFDACHGQRRIVSYRPCGAPIYAVYQVSHYYGRPFGQWVTQNTPCGCSRCNPRVHPGRGGFFGHPGFRGNSCAPYRPSFGRVGSGIFFGFGR